MRKTTLEARFKNGQGIYNTIEYTMKRPRPYTKSIKQQLKEKRLNKCNHSNISQVTGYSVCIKCYEILD